MVNSVIRAGKWEPIRQYCSGKRVLDVGCVGDYSRLEEIRGNIFYRLQKHADVYGIDINQEGIKYLSTLGCKCRVLNAAHVDELSEGKFDGVLLGDIIEHMPDVSSFLVKVRACLKPTGVVICTTPNAFHYLNSLSMLLHKPVTRRQHTMWFCSVTLKNIFRFSGYVQEQMIFLNFWDDFLRSGRRNPLRFARFLIEKVLFSLNPELSPLLMGVYRPVPAFSDSFVEQVYTERWHP